MKNSGKISEKVAYSLVFLVMVIGILIVRKAYNERAIPVARKYTVNVYYPNHKKTFVVNSHYCVLRCGRGWNSVRYCTKQDDHLFCDIKTIYEGIAPAELE